MPQLTIILAFVIVLTAEAGRLQPAPLALAIAAPVAYLAIASLAASANSWLALRRLVTDRPTSTRAIRRYRRGSSAVQLFLILGLAGLISFSGFGYLLFDRLGLQNIPLLGTLVAVAPFALGLMLVWIIQFPVHRHLRRRGSRSVLRPLPPQTLGQYLDLNIRHQLLFVAVPISLIVLGQDLIRLYLQPRLPHDQLGQGITGAALLVIAGTIFLLAPAIIIRIWHTNSLPPSDLRSRLDELCNRLHLRYRDILVWRSGGTLANAGVMGVTAQVRYILLSDLLLDRMADEQIEAVFAHEAGHVIGHHILYMGVFVLATAGLAMAGAYLLANILGLNDYYSQVVALLMMAGMWVLGFGPLSRRLERHSDVIGAWACQPTGSDAISPAGAATFASALQLVGMLNGTSAAQPNWRHGSIASRVNYVLRMGAMGLTRRHVDGQIRRIKGLLWLLFILAAGLQIIIFARGGFEQ